MSLEVVRAMVLSGELGRAQQVSGDDRQSWREASAVPELWETPLEFPPPDPRPPKPRDEADEFPPPDPRPPKPRDEAELTRLRQRTRLGYGMAIAGFVCVTAGLVAALIPLLIWAFQSDGFYSFVPVAFPILTLSITGLVLSGASFFRNRSGFAVAGLVVGIVATLLGAITCIGWLVVSDPRERWVDEALKVTTFDVAREDREFAAMLKMYREGSLGRDEAELLQDATLQLMKLTRAHKRHVEAAARTPRFRRAFLELDLLKKAFDDYRDSLTLKAELKPNDAIIQAGETPTTLKELLDILDLYRTGKISLETAQAKCRELGP
jgi:hypothetical protein